MIRVRFAPSPTGYLHIGSARTALFNWLYARRHGGKLILRIEDTDTGRSKKEFLDEILEDLRWLGLDWDEGPIFQSQRFETYRKAAEEVIKRGKGYREDEAFIFKVEGGRTIEIGDMIHGKISFNTDDIKDQVMIKSDGSPAYNFSCVIDDAEEDITHIIRGDDHVSNTPKQVMFYEALGLKIPQFGHMPLIMGADGAKLSKRHGGVSVEEYKSQGFLPEAVVNYLLLLGWSPGDNREIIPMDEAVRIFEIDRMTGVQAKFDIQKFRWMNGEYMMAKKDEELLPLVKEQIARMKAPAPPPDSLLLKIIGLYKMRAKTLAEFVEMTDYFSSDTYTIDEKGAQKHLAGSKNKGLLGDYAARLEAMRDFSCAAAEEACRSMAEEKGIKASEIIHPARMALSGKTSGAGLFEMMEVLGKEKVLERLRKAAG
jgi:glutamyl-tRNA synthetase